MMHLITGKKGQPHITAENQGFINSEIFGSDNYVFEFSENFEAVKLDDNHIQIKDGQGMMNGRHFEIEKDTTEQVSIDSGAIGYIRFDLIVARYTKNQSGIENVELAVIKGQTKQGILPVDPGYNEGNILDGDTLVDFPLYRVVINDLEISEIEPLFTAVEVNISEIGEGLQALEDEVQELIDSQVVDKDYVPSLFSGIGEPPSEPQGGGFGNNEPKYGDIFISHYYGENFKMYVLYRIAYNQAHYPTHYEWKRVVMEEELDSKIDRIDAPKIYYGTTDPSYLVADYPNLMLGDLYFQYALGSGTRDGFGEIQKIWMAGISSQNEDTAVWREITTSLSAKWSDYYSKTQTDNLLSDKLDRDDGIKIFYGTTDPSQLLLDGSKSGDIYIRLNGGNDRDMSQVVGMWIVSVYPSGGTYYWQKIPLGDYYNKTETDNLLNAKQDLLTEGNNIEIDADNVISYQESEWELIKTVEATEDNPLSEIVWQASDLDNGTYDDIMVKATNVQGNTVGNYGMQCKTTANKFNVGLFGALLSSAVSTTVARNFFTTIERLNGTTEFDISSWYVDNYLNKEQRIIQTAPGLVADNPSHKLYYVRFYFSSTNTIKSGTFKIYGRKRIYGTTAQLLNSPLNLNRDEITLDGTLPEELEGGLLKNVETDVSDTELNEINNSEVKKEVSETEKKTEIEEPETDVLETEKESEIDDSEIEE